jgi:hypothetical protein
LSVLFGAVAKAHDVPTIASIDAANAIGKADVLAADLGADIRPLGNPRVTLCAAGKLDDLNVAGVLDAVGWATSKSAVGADGGSLCFGLYAATEATEGLCCFVHGGGWLGFGNGDFERLVLWLAGQQLAKDFTVLDWISLGDVGSGGLAEDLNGLEQVGETAVDVEGGNLVADVGGDGHGVVWLIGALSPADVKRIPNRLGYARKISNYFHGPKSGSFSPLNKELANG